MLMLTRRQMGGFSGADLAIAVSKAGGLGQIGAVFDMDELKGNLEKVERTLDSSEGVLPVGVGYVGPLLVCSHDDVVLIVQCASLRDQAQRGDTRLQALPTSRHLVVRRPRIGRLRNLGGAHPSCVATFDDLGSSWLC